MSEHSDYPFKSFFPRCRICPFAKSVGDIMSKHAIVQEDGLINRQAMGGSHELERIVALSCGCDHFTPGLSRRRREHFEEEIGGIIKFAKCGEGVYMQAGNAG